MNFLFPSVTLEFLLFGTNKLGQRDPVNFLFSHGFVHDWLLVRHWMILYVPNLTLWLVSSFNNPLDIIEMNFCENMTLRC